MSNVVDKSRRPDRGGGAIDNRSDQESADESSGQEEDRPSREVSDRVQEHVARIPTWVRQPQVVTAIAIFAGYFVVAFFRLQYYDRFGVSLAEVNLDLPTLAVLLLVTAILLALLSLGVFIGSSVLFGVLIKWPSRAFFHRDVNTRSFAVLVTFFFAVSFCLYGPGLLADDMRDGRVGPLPWLVSRATGIAPDCVTIDGPAVPQRLRQEPVWLIGQSEQSHILFDPDTDQVFRVAGSSAVLTSDERSGEPFAGLGRTCQ